MTWSGLIPEENRYSELTGQWGTVHAQWVRDHAEKQDLKVATWRDQQAAMQRQQRWYQQRCLWISGRRNLLSVIGRARCERSHTAILAWLLDPAAPHGLGTTFLRRFLERCIPGEPQLYPNHSLAAARTATEVSRANSRADIVVTLPTVVLIVEAKVDSLESESQCARLYADFTRLAATQTRFAFLTPQGRRPTTDEVDAAGQFRVVSFREIEEDLKAVIGQIAVRKTITSTISGFAAVIDYLSLLDEEF